MMASQKRFRARVRSRIIRAAAMCAVVECLVSARSTMGDTNATWNPASGGEYWTTAADWSTNPYYPDNGTPSGVNYAAAFPAGEEYLVFVNSNITVDSATLGSGAILQVNSGTLDAGTVSGSGSFLIQGGSIVNTTVNSNGLGVYGGILNGDTLNGAATWDGGASIQNNLSSTTGATIEFEAGSLTADGGDQTISDVLLEPATTPASLTVYPSGPDSAGAQTLTLASNTSVQNGVTFENGHVGDTLVNDGSISTPVLDEPGLTIETTNFTNNGTMDQNEEQMKINCAGTVTNSSTGSISGEVVTLSISGGSIIIAYEGCELDGPVTNSGTIAIGASPAIFSGSVANTGTFQINGGGGSLAGLTSSAGSVDLYGANTDSGSISITGGSFEAGGTLTGDLTFSTSSPTYLADLYSKTDYDQLSLTGNAVLSGDLAVSLLNSFQPTSSESFTILTVANGYTLSGSFANVASGGELAVTGGEFEVFYGGAQYPDEIVLTDFQELPEPASLSLLTLGASALMMRRRGARRLK